ncbi:helix-turn-helix domain-containing protein [Streptomyces sp. NBC_00654]|uniref:helix-turn-helix domain-containing protein n=1 Tax=Streptomyces sp. NBC_00654 TaxID=2975799 RepID=UPI002250036E|nr:helix-turn-helix transcriptional regulator [Streptomyces sp. NBC_00654]MCX4970467.1 helix-turn-helix domain-containing protein [Streptomyces sp. NBC_00654]
MTGCSPVRRSREGAVTGHLFKVIREQVPRTQGELAEALGVDTTTVQGWESGRRPLTSTHAGNLRAISRTLLRLGAPSLMLMLLDEAVDADAVIAHALSGPPALVVSQHPLAGWVFTRNTTHMLAWALNGTQPAALPTPEAPKRRGPSRSSPLLAPTDRLAFYDHMRRAAELADHVGEDGALLRRQALYLCSYDTAHDTRAWLADMRRHNPGPRSGWTPHWADTRSVAASLTRHGDREPLYAFIQNGMGDETGEVANLNYWAYWLGIDQLPRPDDTFMIDRSDTTWDGLALLRKLADRLSPDLACIDLNAHTVWALLASRRGLLAADPHLNRALAQQVTTLLDGDSISSQTRREMESVHYGLTLHT